MNAPSDVRRVDVIGHRVRADVAVPGSKSVANRALVIAALADRPSVLTNVPDGDDTAAMLAALGRLGLDIGHDGDQVTVGPVGTDWPETTLHAGLAGTTSRFVTALAALGRRPVTVDGDPPLRTRPFGPLHDALASLGASVTTTGDGRLPATVTGPLRAGTVAIRGDVSSQYITALMLVAPLLPEGLTIELTTDLVSVPYVELTAAMMGWFGVEGVEVAPSAIRVPAGTYRGRGLHVEPDASSASYPLALAAVVGGRVGVDGLGLGSVQGDARFTDLLAEMGCGVSRTGDRVTVESGADLRGIDVDMSDVSDLVPTLAVVAACASSPTRIRGVGFIRAKESDRLGDLAHELRTLGVDIHVHDDGLDIGPSASTLRAGRVETHHDHRLAMAFGVLGARIGGVEVSGPGVVSKSWPGYWDMLTAVANA